MEKRIANPSWPVTVYVTRGNPNSEYFGAAFARGSGGRMFAANKFLNNDGAGLVLPDIFKVFTETKAAGRNFFYGDKAYFGRGKYFRITKNAEQHDCSGAATPNRFEATGFKIKPWKTIRNDFILLCPQSDLFFSLRGMNPKAWVQDTILELRKYTDRKIIVHYKSGGVRAEDHFQPMLRTAYAVVVYSSMAGAQACLSGVPCFALDKNCASAKFGLTDLSKINSPFKPDNREQLAWNLADNQWTLDEMKKGIAWERLCPQ